MRRERQVVSAGFAGALDKRVAVNDGADGHGPARVRVVSGARHAKDQPSAGFCTPEPAHPSGMPATYGAWVQPACAIARGAGLTAALGGLLSLNGYL